MFNNKNVLITGGTGSFGTAFVKRILKKYNPKKIIIFSRDEYKQSIMKEDPFFIKKKNVRFFVGDVRDRDRLNLAFSGVDYVVHAAAMKQIPATERDPLECIKTNVYGAENIIQASLNNKIKKVIALSTDKASSPINLYGATKLTSDKLFVSGNAYSGEHPTRFSVVRYGNVMGSRGSVIPFFNSIKESGIVTITDTRMTRFMISLDDAVDLVIKAFEDMIGGEIYVKKIPSMKITDIAKVIAPDAEQKIIGIRPGEKLHEQMIGEEDSPYTYEYDDYYKILPVINNWSDDEERIQDGEKVDSTFTYNSKTNSDWMSSEQLQEWLDKNKEKMGIL